MIGEIGGPDEANAAYWIKENMKKPVVGFIAGVTRLRASAWATPALDLGVVPTRPKPSWKSWKPAVSRGDHGTRRKWLAC
ncbi:hypothetical protein ACTMU2_23245 [Cupriavidus basilensis]